MEAIRISETRLKIILDSEERRRYAVPDRALAEDVRGFLRRILGEAEGRPFWEASAGTLSLTVYDGLDGGCEIFLTRLAAATAVTPCVALWDTEGLFRLCHRLKATGYGGESRLYRLAERWYLCLEAGASPVFLGDYGETVGEDVLGYIGEYGVCLSEDPVSALGQGRARRGADEAREE